MAAAKLQAFWNHPAGPKTKWWDHNCDPRTKSSKGNSTSAVVEMKTQDERDKSVSALMTTADDFLCSFWAPTFKWGISIANVADFSKPPEKLSYPQQIAVTCTGLIWSRYSMVITPKNWNLLSVNVAMAGTGLYQLSRKIKHDYFPEKEAAVAEGQ